MTGKPFSSGAVDLGEGVSVEFTFDGSRLDCAWLPDLPKPEVGRRLLPAYRDARHAFFLSMSERLGVNIAVVDL